MSEICRLCLDKTGSVSIFSLSAARSVPEDDKEMLYYSEQITQCTRLQIQHDDGLPSFMCSMCEAELAVSYSFFVKCQNSDAALRRMKTEGSLHSEGNTVVKTEHQHLGYVKEEALSDRSFSDEDIPLDKPNATSQYNEDYSEGVGSVKKSRRPRKRSVLDYVEKKVLKNESNSSIQCPTCGLLVKSPSAMKIHLSTHTKLRPYECDQCKATFKTKGNLKRHTISNHTLKDKSFMCEACGKGFYSKRDIIIHMRRHTGEKPHVCSYCARTFSQIGSLIRHKRIHTGDKPFPCPICSKKFRDKSMVSKHMSVHTNEKKFSCHLCGNSVKTSQALSQHMNLHTNEKPFVCSYCGLTFAAKGNMRIHISRVHSEKSGQCNICNKTFSDISQHMNKHTGDVPFKCKYCPRAFNSIRSLSNHCKYRHENSNTFKCSEEDCNRAFPLKSMLQFHLLKQHTNQTPFICQYCPRGFYRASDLSRHLRVNHSQIVGTIKQKSGVIRQ